MLGLRRPQGRVRRDREPSSRKCRDSSAVSRATLGRAFRLLRNRLLEAFSASFQAFFGNLNPRVDSRYVRCRLRFVSRSATRRHFSAFRFRQADFAIDGASCGLLCCCAGFTVAAAVGKAGLGKTVALNWIAAQSGAAYCEVAQHTKAIRPMFLMLHDVYGVQRDSKHTYDLAKDCMNFLGARYGPPRPLLTCH